ncbi:MAG: substrate binding domain-containing protein, partial [Pigmentiphaga sp.]
ASYVVAPVLPSFRQQYPGIMVDIEVGNQKEGALEDFDITLLGADANFDGSVIARKVAESEVMLVASPAYVARKGAPQTPEELLSHDCLRLKNDDGQLWPWRMWSDQQREEDVEVDAVLVANHTDTLLRATLDGVGITSMSVDIAAPYLNRGELIRVLSPWSTGRVAMFAALPSRKFIPRRTRVFLDYFVDYTRAQSKKALAACEAC